MATTEKYSFDQIHKLYWQVAQEATQHSSDYASLEEVSSFLSAIEVHIETLEQDLSLQTSRIKDGPAKPLDIDLMVSPLGDIRSSLQTGHWHSGLEKLRFHLVSFHEDRGESSAYVDFGKMCQAIEYQEGIAAMQWRMLTALEKKLHPSHSSSPEP